MNEQQLAAVKLALEAFDVLTINDYSGYECSKHETDKINDAITALQSIIQEAQPAPVKTYSDGKPWPVAPKPWVGLTDEEVMQTMSGDWTSQFYFARAIEAKLREKNGITAAPEKGQP